MNNNLGRTIGLSACVLVVALLAYVSYAPERKADGEAPLSHWAFDKDGVIGAEVRDRTGRLPGILRGPPATREGPGLELHDHEIVLRDPLRPGDRCLPAEALTLLAWVRIDDTNRLSAILGALSDSGPVEKGFVLGHDDARFLFGLTAQRGEGKGKMERLVGRTALEARRWHHVAATYDGKVMRLYVDGQLDGSSAKQAGPIVYARSGAFVLGSYRSGREQQPLRGALHEVLIYHRALSGAEVAKHFAANARLTKLPPAPAKPRFVVAPYLQYPTRSSISVMWETSVAGTSVVRYGVGALAETKSGPADVTLHEVALTGLRPNTPYLYQVISKGADGKVLTSPVLTFQTAVNAESAFSFAMFGDTQRNPAVTRRIAKLAWERRPNFVVHLGDVVDEGKDKRQWVDDLFGPCGELFGRVAVFPCIGNHEKNHAHYYQYFALPAPEYYYQYRYGNADFFSIDSNKRLAPDSEQYKWLDAALAKSSAKWKFVYHHHPPYSSDDDDFGNTWKGERSKMGDPNVRQLVALYEKHNVDLVFNGHCHVYERTWPIRAGKVDRKRGVIYITSGGGGGALESFSPVPTWFKAQNRSDYHFCYVTIHGGRLGLKAFDEKGNLFDSFELDK